MPDVHTVPVHHKDSTLTPITTADVYRAVAEIAANEKIGQPRDEEHNAALIFGEMWPVCTLVRIATSGLPARNTHEALRVLRRLGFPLYQPVRWKSDTAPLVHERADIDAANYTDR